MWDGWSDTLTSLTVRLNHPHSNWSHSLDEGPLIAGCTSVIFEGKPVGTPDAGAYWRVMKANNVNVFFTAPTAIRAMRKEDPFGEELKGIGGEKLPDYRLF
jgi:acyl-coenzyme A synthetase/AMP-(fatty) acid ligase